MSPFAARALDPPRLFALFAALLLLFATSAVPAAGDQPDGIHCPSDQPPGAHSDAIDGATGETTVDGVTVS